MSASTATKPMTLGPQLHIGHVIELFEDVPPVSNLHVKPTGGFWTSSYSEQGSAWVHWCKDENFCAPEQQSWFLLDVDPAARILVIDSLRDLSRLLEEAAYKPFPDLHCDYPDFEHLSKSWDAMHLTERGQWATRLSEPSLYGWDCESTLWFRWCFTAWRKIEAPKGSV